MIATLVATTRLVMAAISKVVVVNSIDKQESLSLVLYVTENNEINIIVIFVCNNHISSASISA